MSSPNQLAQKLSHQLGITSSLASLLPGLTQLRSLAAYLNIWLPKYYISISKFNPLQSRRLCHESIHTAGTLSPNTLSTNPHGAHEVSMTRSSIARLRRPQDFQAQTFPALQKQCWLLGISISISRIHNQPKPLNIHSSQARRGFSAWI